MQLSGGFLTLLCSIPRGILSPSPCGINCKFVCVRVVCVCVFVCVCHCEQRNCKTFSHKRISACLRQTSVLYVMNPQKCSGDPSPFLITVTTYTQQVCSHTLHGHDCCSQDKDNNRHCHVPIKVNIKLYKFLVTSFITGSCSVIMFDNIYIQVLKLSNIITEQLPIFQVI